MFNTINFGFKPAVKQENVSPNKVQTNQNQVFVKNSGDQVAFSGFFGSNNINRDVMKEFNYLLKHDQRLSYPLTYTRCHNVLPGFKPDKFKTISTKIEGNNIEFQMWFMENPPKNMEPNLKVAIDLQTGHVTPITPDCKKMFSYNEIKEVTERNLKTLNSVFKGHRTFLKTLAIEFPDNVEPDISGIHLVDLDKEPKKLDS